MRPMTRQFRLIEPVEPARDTAPRHIELRIPIRTLGIIALVVAVSVVVGSVLSEIIILHEVFPRLG